MTVFRYLTETERVEARRETWRKNSRRQYDLYRQLCRRFGVDGAGPRWTTHLAELRELAFSRAALANADLLRVEKDPMKRYWLKRFTLDEIHRIARGL